MAANGTASAAVAELGSGHMRLPTLPTQIFPKKDGDYNGGHRG
jgi:hypothetical protein